MCQLLGIGRKRRLTHQLALVAGAVAIQASLLGQIKLKTKRTLNRRHAMRKFGETWDMGGILPHASVMRFVQISLEVGSRATLRISLCAAILIPFIFFSALAADIYIPGKKEFKETSGRGDNLVSETKIWSEEGRQVGLSLISLFGLPEAGVPPGSMTEEDAFQFHYQEVLDDISENWGERKELEPIAGFGTVYYKSFDAKKLNLEDKAKCVSFYGYYETEAKIVFGFYCKAKELPDSEVELALKSIRIDDTEASLPVEEHTISFLAAGWDGKIIPDGQQCTIQSGKNPHSPKLKISNLPSGTKYVLMLITDEIDGPTGSHGIFRLNLPDGATELIIPPIYENANELPTGVTLVQGCISKECKKGHYMPPCSGGDNHNYYADITAFGDGDKKLVNNYIDWGKY